MPLTPSLFIMGALDLLAGLIVLGIPYSHAVHLMIYTIPYSIAIYFGIALIIKGIYSIIFGFIGGN